MNIKRGEIYLVDLNPIKGKEQAGRRPVLVLSIDEINGKPLVITVVVGTKGVNIKKDYAVNVRVPAVDSGLKEETVFLCFQIRSLDVNRFPEKPSGKLPDEYMGKIENTVRYCLGL